MKTGSLGTRVTLVTLALLVVVLTGVIAAVTIAYRSNREQDLADQLRAAGGEFVDTLPGDVTKFFVADLARHGIAVDFEDAVAASPGAKPGQTDPARAKPDPPSIGPDSQAGSAKTTLSSQGAAATTAPAIGGSNPLDAAVQAALDAGTITEAQADTLRRQIDEGSIDLQELVNSGTLTAPEMQALQDRLDAVKKSIAVAQGRPAGSASISTLGSLVVLDQPLPDGTQVVLSASNDAIDADVQQLLGIEIGVALVALVFAALLIRRVTAAALRPLADVSQTATRIAGGNTADRLRPARTDTELGSMAAAFDHMVDALEEAVRQAKGAEETMRRFLADASHELRTPIAALQATAESLLRDQPRRPRRDALEATLAGDAARLGRLVDDLLSLARLDAAHPAPSTRLDLVRLAEAAVAEIDRQRPGSAVALEPGASVCVAGDPDALARVIRNLLDNALAAAGPGGHVRLRVTETADEASLSVEDDGPGVPEAERERIFDRFVRLTPGASSGSGLGLAIARRIARQHRGDITCDEVHPGARFTLRLPLPEPVEPTRPSGSLEDRRANGEA